MSHESMVHVLMEIHLAERKLTSLGIRQDSIRPLFERTRPVIFKKVGVDEKQFKESFEYYKEHPQELETIYSTLIDSLNLREQRAQMDKPVERKRDAVPK